jgi:hypothetical protein
MAAEPHKWLADYLNRHLTTPKQQKNYLVDTRNEIRKRFGDSHPALSIAAPGSIQAGHRTMSVRL